MESILAKPEYRYEPLEEGEIRILELHPGSFEDPIRCDLVRTKLQDATDTYVAISYAWITTDYEETTTTPETWTDEQGALHLHKAQILCSGARTDVTVSLHGALKHLRFNLDLDAAAADDDWIGKTTTGVRRLWADALCINQADNAERSAQVRLMQRIYRGAARVVVWLGEETPEVQGALDYLPRWVERQPPEGIRKEGDDYWAAEVRRPFSAEYLAYWDYQTQVFPPIFWLFTRRWWRRRWVVQELVEGKDAILMCGDKYLAWDALAKLEEDQYILHDIIPQLYAKSLWPYVARSVINVCKLSKLRQYFHGQPRYSDSALSSMFIDCEHFHCSDPRDYLYSLLGLFPIYWDDNKHGHLLHINYDDPVGATAARLSRYFMSTLSDPLWHFQYTTGTRQRYSRDDSFSVTPSWACAFLNPFFDGDYSSGFPIVPPYESISPEQPSSRLKEGETWRFDASGRVLSIRCAVVAKVEEILLPSQERYVMDRRAWAKDVRGIVKKRFPADNDDQAEEFFRDLYGCGVEKEDRLEHNYGSLCRSLCCTSTEHLAFIPSNAAVGDDICIVSNYPALYVIAECGEGHYNILGDCYVQGLSYQLGKNSNPGFDRIRSLETDWVRSF